MSKRCARCEKTVYPIEELKCLDKVWHKGCFKCQECGMTLSMKTYKGFNKLPYCEAHIPKAKATTVAETPEMKRLAENTKNQSNVQYHADFEKNKARFTQVADDPETMRIKQNTKNISNVTYHGDLEKKAQMEQRRTDEDGEVAEPPHQQPPAPQPTLEHRPQMTTQQPRGPTYPVASTTPAASAPSSRAQTKPQQYYSQPPPQQQHHHQQQPPPQQHQQQQQRGYPNTQYYGGSSHPPAQYQQQSYPNHSQPPKAAYSQNPQSKYPPQNVYHPQQAQQAHMYQDPNHNSPYSSRNSQTLIYSSQTGPVAQATEQNVGSIADYDPMNNQFGSINQITKQPPNTGGYRQENTYQTQRSHGYHDQGNPSRSHNQGPQHMPQQQHHKVHAPPTNLGRCFRAVYDYEAADTDEISFKDGDLITNCTSIDEGWMTGTVQRTGRTGMLPANYVERAN